VVNLFSPPNQGILRGVLVRHKVGTAMYGELIPEGGGDPIPLIKPNLVIGRREICDIVLRFPNVSGQHCQLTLDSGYWYIQDMNSQNGVKVNGMRVAHKLLENGDMLVISTHRYKIFYSPMECGATGPPPAEGNELVNIMSKTLLERAGLERKKNPKDKDQRRDS